MSYTTLEAALQTILLADTATFKSGDVSLADYRILDAGIGSAHGNNKAVLVPGNFPGSSIASYVSARTWDILVDLFVKYASDADWAAFKTARDAVILDIETHPSLGLYGDVLVQSIVGEGDPLQVKDKNGQGPFFLLQTIRVTVEERVALSTGEFTT